jgi:quercetin 2,3-dioxygenase
MGNRGKIEAGDLQWMTAGRGIVHSEVCSFAFGTQKDSPLHLSSPSSAVGP